MTIQPIGLSNIALYITPADLEERGLTPEALTSERAMKLTREAFCKAGIQTQGTLEIEAYPSACGVLVFAHIVPPRRCWISFSSLEGLLSAPIPPGLGEAAALYWFEGRWWLSLPREEEALAARLSEFGRTERESPYLDARLEEHGRLIWERDALSALKRLF